MYFENEDGTSFTRELEYIFDVIKKEPTSIDDKDSGSDDNIIIFPNPASDYIEISGVVGVVKLFDVLGIEVSTSPSATLYGDEGSKVRVDVSGLAPGVYFVKIGSLISKFIKY